MDQPGKVANPARGQLNRENEYSPVVPVCMCLRIWSRETGSTVPSRITLLILDTQAESGAYLRNSSRVPRRRPFIYIKPPYYVIGSVPILSGHAIAYTDGVHCQESAGTGAVNLKVVHVYIPSPEGRQRVSEKMMENVFCINSVTFGGNTTQGNTRLHTRLETVKGSDGRITTVGFII